MEFETRAIHAGQEPEQVTGSVNVPIFQTSTYVQDGVGQMRSGHDYARTVNPTRTALQTCLAALEGGAHGVAFSSGMAAISAVLGTFRPGTRTLAMNDVYGGTYRLFSKILEPQGSTFEYADLADLETVENALTRGPQLVWVETPTNPLLKIVDIAAIAERAHSVGAVVVVDNTFASPYLQQPLALGADIVVHSTTKYIGGHSDAVGGIAITSDDDRREALVFLQNSIGSVPGSTAEAAARPVARASCHARHWKRAAHDPRQGSRHAALAAADLPCRSAARAGARPVAVHCRRNARVLPVAWLRRNRDARPAGRHSARGRRVRRTSARCGR